MLTTPLLEPAQNTKGQLRLSKAQGVEVRRLQCSCTGWQRRRWPSPVAKREPSGEQAMLMPFRQPSSWYVCRQRCVRRSHTYTARGGGGRSKDCKVSNHQHSGRNTLGCLRKCSTGTSASKRDKTRGCLRCPTCAVAAAGEELGAVCCECTSAGSAIHLQRANHLRAQMGEVWHRVSPQSQPERNRYVDPFPSNHRGKVPCPRLQPPPGAHSFASHLLGVQANQRHVALVAKEGGHCRHKQQCSRQLSVPQDIEAAAAAPAAPPGRASSCLW